MSARASRAGRGWLVAFAATVVAAVSHTLAAGVPPTAFGFGASLVLAGTASALLSGRRQSLWRLTASVAISQVLFHSLFSGMGTPTAAVHGHSLAAVSPIHDHAAADMWLAHLLAGLVTVVLLRHAESAVLGLAASLRLAAGRMLALPTAVEPLPALPLVPGTRALRPRARLLDATPMTYRGPPRELRAA
ncbi:hypothetical protein [Antiquaquibacter soli]|uniref:MFS transporter n=1 Tax=Antiquaquibacter soli TaxID=3064523 RepID=A0ABT9BMQ3_9MICO|nr:hypothetical protein [Protaetiibacter sp. WY-16]MDO7882316.1 hypothetical protein [Protaetiibacter sp. WY-16]